MPLTYEPKVEGVRNGTIRHSIRKWWGIEPGDQVAFHGWEGVPYRSKWSFRTEYFTVRSVNLIKVEDMGIEWYISPDAPPVAFSTWEQLDPIAQHDGIDPPTGTALRDVLLSNGVTGKSQIIRW